MATLHEFWANPPPGAAPPGPLCHLFPNLQLLWNASAPRFDSVRGQLATYNTPGNVAVAYRAAGDGITTGSGTVSSITWPNRQTAAQTKYTFFGVITPTASGVNQIFLSTTSASGQGVWMFVTSAGTTITWTKPGVVDFASISVTAGTTYAFIASHDESTDAYWMMVRPLTGGATVSVSGTDTGGSNGGNGEFSIGGRNDGGTNSVLSPIHAAGIAFDYIPQALGYAFLDTPWHVFARAPSRKTAAGGPATYNVDLTETATATDALTVIASYVLAVSESATATDAASAVATWPASVSESTTASEIVAAVQTLGAAVAETVTASDLVSAILAAAAAISDAATATDATTSSLNGNVYSADVSEAATSTDTVAAVAQMVAQIAESASSGDAYAVAANLVALLTETGSPADVVAVPGGYSVSLTEAAAALDVVAAAVAGVITPSAAPFGHGPDAGRRLGALLGRRAGTFSRTR